MLPVSRGFDSHLGYLLGAEDHVTHYKLNSSDFFDGILPAVEYNGIWSTPLFNKRAIDIIETYGNKSKSSQPLFLYIAYQDSHYPPQAPQR